MIRHTILFKPKSNVTHQQLEEAFRLFKQLKNRMPGIIEVLTSECQFFDEKSQHFFEKAISHVISIDFYDEKALQRFFVDPVTHPAKSAVINIVEGGYEHIFGFDFK